MGLKDRCATYLAMADAGTGGKLTFFGCRISASVGSSALMDCTHGTKIEMAMLKLNANWLFNMTYFVVVCGGWI